MCSLNARYDAALSTSLHHFRQLLASSASRSWTPLNPSSPSTPASTPILDARSTSAALKGKAREFLHGLGAVEPGAVAVHKRAVKGAPDVVRAVAEVGTTEGVDLDSFRAVLQTPEVRSACKSGFGGWVGRQTGSERGGLTVARLWGMQGTNWSSMHIR